MFVVRGVCCAPGLAPTRSFFAAGLEVRNDRSRSVGARDSVSVFGFVAPSVLTFDRMECNWVMTASLRAFSCFNARFNFLVSCNCFR